MIRVMLGLLLVLGSVGTMEYDPNFPLTQGVAQAVIGLALMYWGSKKMK